jgi:multidrug resistance efflux pump
LFVIDPSDYRIAVDQAQAIVEEAKERMTLARAEAVRRAQLSEVVVSIEQKQIYEICSNICGELPTGTDSPLESRA